MSSLQADRYTDSQIMGSEAVDTRLYVVSYQIHNYFVVYSTNLYKELQVCAIYVRMRVCIYVRMHVRMYLGMQIGWYEGMYV